MDPLTQLVRTRTDDLHRVAARIRREREIRDASVDVPPAAVGRSARFRLALRPRVRSPHAEPAEARGGR